MRPATLIWHLNYETPRQYDQKRATFLYPQNDLDHENFVSITYQLKLINFQLLESKV